METVPKDVLFLLALELDEKSLINLFSLFSQRKKSHMLS